MRRRKVEGMVESNQLFFAPQSSDFWFFFLTSIHAQEKLNANMKGKAIQPADGVLASLWCWLTLPVDLHRVAF
jgi:hypothetical protein